MFCGILKEGSQNETKFDTSSILGAFNKHAFYLLDNV